MSGFLPADLANQALDAIGRPFAQIGDLEDGSESAQVLLRAYGECLRQLLTAAHWNWARKEAPLLLLADASGNTPNVGTQVPQGWLYSYALPDDCMKPRFVPWNLSNQGSAIPQDNIQIPETPLVTGNGDLPVPMRPRPARFLVATDYNNLPPTPSYNTPGVSPIGRSVILTNVRHASLVYTAFLPYPSLFDSLFRAAFVAYLAAEIALPLWAKEDKKFGLSVRVAQEGIVRGKVTQARATDGNAQGPTTSDLSVDWMNVRYSGGPFGMGWGGMGYAGPNSDGPGVWGYGFDSLSLPSGAIF